MRAPGLSGDAAIAAWMDVRGADVARIRKAVADLSTGGLTLARATVAASLIGDIVKE